jgi:hypothetical protein
MNQLTPGPAIVAGPSLLEIAMTLATQMQELLAFVGKALTDQVNPDHCSVCNMTAEKYDLWEDDHFPLWLSFVVQGVMRELGIEN